MDGLERIAAERLRQIEKGWTPQHDDDHFNGELAEAAGALAVNREIRDNWGLVYKHRGNRLRQLEIAGALIVAEIDRLQRADG